MLKVGSKFDTFDELSQRLEEFQKIERVQLWVRDSRTVIAAAKRARRKSLNPALKYAELTYSCVFGGRRPSDQTKVHNQTSAGGCPFKVRLSTSGDGQALIVKEICHNHNHEPGKKLHDEPRRLYKKTHHSRAAAASTAAPTDAQENGAFSVQQQAGGTSTNSLGRNNNKQPIKLIVSKHRLNSAGSPFANLQQLQPQQQQQHVPPLKLHLHTTVHQQHSYVKKEQPDQMMEVDIGPSPISDLLNTPDHMYSMLDYHAMGTPNSGAPAFPFNGTPSSDSGLSSNSAGVSLSNTPSSLSLSNTPSSSIPNTPDTSPTNSLSSGLDDPINFNMPLSPISPRLDEDEERNLEPIYDLSEYLEGGLASLPSVDSEDLPLLTSASRPQKVSAIQQQVRVGMATAGSGPFSSGSMSQLPVVRAHTPAASGATTTVRLGLSSNNLMPYRPKTVASGSGNIYVNTEGGLVKAIKTSGASTVLANGRPVLGGGGGGSSSAAVPSVHYNLVPNKLSSSSGCKIAGKITIQQFLSGSSTTGKGVTLNTASPTTTAASVLGGTSGNSHYLLGSNSSAASGSSVTTGSLASSSPSCSSTSSNSCGLPGTPVTTVGCSLVNSAGPVRNYRAKIAKKPYGGVLKVVRSDSISSPEKSMDRLINTVTPNKINFVEVSNKMSGNKPLVFDHSQQLAPAARNLFSCSDISDGKSFEDFVRMDLQNSLLPEMDKIISGGGLDADIRIKTELAEGVTDHISDLLNYTQTIDRLPGAPIKEENSLDDEISKLDSIDDLSNLFVLDGLEPSLGGDIPITPESYFSAADMDKYDFYMF